MLLYLKLLVVVVLTCFVIEINSSTEIGEAKSRILSRKRRYLTFPDGASFSAAVCLTVGVLGQPAPITSPGTFVLAVNWGIAYELPNETQTVATIRQFERIKKPAAMRRNRRELYDKVETIMDNMGYNGRECILKTLCETTHRIAPRTKNMMETIFRTIFTFPTKIHATEPREHAQYDAAQQGSTSIFECEQYSCPLSLVDLIKGYYNLPAPSFDTSVNPLSWFSQPFG